MKLASAGALLAALLFGCRAEAPPKKAPAELVVGVVASLTGPSAVYGVPLANGIELAVSEARAQGRKVRLVLMDDQGRGEDAELAAQHLLKDEPELALILTGGASATAVAVARVAERAELPMIAASATHPAVTDQGAHVFRACFADPFQAQAMARYAREQLHLETAAVLRDPSSEYSALLADGFKARFLELGGKITADESYDAGASEHRTSAEKVASSKPAAVYLPAYAQDVAKLGPALRARGFEGVLLGADGWDARALLDDRSGALQGSLFTTHAAVEDPDPAMQRFLAAYREVYNELPDALSALGYDAAKLGLEAAAGGGRPSDITARLGAMGEVQGVLGPLRLDEKRSAVRPAVLLELRGGKRKVLARLRP